MKEKIIKEWCNGAKSMKRLFSIVLVLAMVFSFMLINSLTVYAESGTNTTKYASVKTAAQLTAALADSTVDVITVENDITVDSSTNNSKSATAIFTVDRTVLIESAPGHQYTIKRSTSSSTVKAKSLFEIWGNGTYDGIQASFENIILDGGAVWDADSNAKTRWEAYAQATGSSKNSGVRGRAVVDVANKGTLNLESGVIIQNGDTCTNSTTRNCGTVGSANYGGGVRIEYDSTYGGGTVNLKVGSVIQDVVSHQWGGAIGAYNYGRLNIYGGTIRRCASQQGAAICCTYSSQNKDTSTASTMKMYGGLIENCYSQTADIYMDGKNPTYNEIYGGTFVNNIGTVGAVSVQEYAKIKIAEGNVNFNSLKVTYGSNVTKESISSKKITFKDGETTIGELDLLYDSTAGKTTSAGASFPADLVKDHAVFLGWYDGENKVTSESTFSGDTTVCAKWGIHQWTYAASNDQLTAKCNGTGNGCTMPNCEYSTDETAVTLTLNATSQTYTGSAMTYGDATDESKNIKITGYNDWISNVGTLEVEFSNDGETSWTTTSPSAKGSYQLRIYPAGQTPDASNTVIASFSITGKIYYVSSAGNDSTGDGSLSKPYKTIKKAYSTLASSAYTEATIALLSDITMDSNDEQVYIDTTKKVIFTSAKADGSIVDNSADNYEGVYNVKRGNITKSLFAIKNGDVTFEQIILDGGSKVFNFTVDNLSADNGGGYLINVLADNVGPTLTLSMNTKLQNNWNIGNSGKAWAGAMAVSSDANKYYPKVDIESNAEISGNKAPRHGGAITSYTGDIYLSDNARIDNNGISYDTSFTGGGGYYGGGAILVYRTSKLHMSGNASITNNYVSGNIGSGKKAVAVQVEVEGKIYLSGNIEIFDNFTKGVTGIADNTQSNIYDKTDSGNSLFIEGKLGDAAKIGITAKSLTNGTKVAEGSSYTVTQSDADKIFDDSLGFSIAKHSTNNELVLSSTITNVSVASSALSATVANLTLNTGIDVNVYETSVFVNGEQLERTKYSISSDAANNKVNVTLSDSLSLGDKVGIQINKNGCKFNDGAIYEMTLSHTHSFTYSANGAVLKATCSNTDGICPLTTSDKSVSLTLTATSLTYSGSPVVKSDVFSLSDFDAFKTATGVPAVSKSDAISAIKIYATDDDGKKTGSDISSSALNVGDYIAEFDITVATDPSTVTKTISVTFSVGQATASVSVAPAANTLTYSGENQELVSATGTVTGGVLKYSLEENGTYSADVPKGKNAGSYKVYYKVVSNSDNYKDSEAAYVDVTIGKKTFDGTMTVSGNILAGYASSGSLTLPELPENSQMMYDTPTTEAAVLSDLSVAGGSLLYKGTADVTDGTPYSVTVPVIAQTGEHGNYNDFTLTVNLIGKNCTHASKTAMPEVPAKCTEDGTKAYSTCDTCGSVFLNGEIIESPEDLVLHAPGHDWKVKADDNKLVASCSRKATCEATDKTLTLSIESKVYDGEAHAGTSISEDEKTAWEVSGLEVPEIVYVGVDGTSYESTTQPTEIGSYEARISYGTGENKKTARASFAINSPITVTFNPNGGRFESEMPPVYVVEGGKVAEPTIAVTNGGMIFYGWYKDPEGDEDDKWDFENDIVTENITLYAVWGYPAGVETEAAEMSVARVKDFYYTGKKITPDVRVYFGGKLLTRNIDYTVSYKNVINASAVSVSNNLIVKDDGTVDCSKVDTAKLPSIIIKGKGNYSKKSVSLNFNILPLTLGDGGTLLDKNVSADITDVYLQDTKKAIKVKPVIKYSGKKLKNNRDYTLVLKTVDAVDASGTAIAAGTEYSNLTLPKGVSGSFVLIATGKGNYTGSFKKEITVSKGELLTLQKANIRIKKIPYSGENLEIQDVIEKGELTVKVKGKTLTYGEDYTVAFAEGCSAQSRLSAGSYPIVITGKGSYTGSKMSDAVVNAVSVKKAVVTFAEDKPVYTGGHIGLNIGNVTVPVKVNGETIQKTLVRGVDYTATVLNDVKAGKAKVKITGIGAFAGSKTVSYRIQKKELTPDMFASGTFTDDTVSLGIFEYYGGAAVIPTATIVNNGTILISPIDYTIKARNNKNAGSEATGTIVGKGNYTGSIKCTFSIGPDNVDAEKTSIAKARVKIENQIYTGNAITLDAGCFKSVKLKVKEDGRTVTKDLVLGRDFEIVEGSYRNNISTTGKVKATVTLRGIGANGFDGYKTVNFRIVKKDLRWWEKIRNLL